MAKRGYGEGTISKQKRNGKDYYVGQITIGYDNDGKQIRKTFGNAKRSVVADKMRKAQVLIDQNIYNDDEIVFSDFFYKWMYAFKINEISGNSFARYETTYRNWINKAPLNSIKTKDLTTLRLQEIMNEMLTQTSASNVKRIFTYINASLKFAIHDNLLIKNPAEGLRFPKVKKKKNYNVFTSEEQRMIIDALEDTALDLMIRVTFATGLRLSEALALTWDDFTDCSINVNKQYQLEYNFDNGIKTRKAVIKELKTEGSEGIVPLPQSIDMLLKKHRIQQNKHKLRIGREYQNNNLIFADDVGNYFEHKRPARRVKKLCKELGIEEKDFHSIRHSYCTRLFEAGVPLKTVQTLMRHKEFRTTSDIYTHVMPEMKEDAVVVLEQFL
ncbi:tyrosine-type recombinase/integrase [Microaceticoccus formicicus]|uniref:tyrosine-type recombinase/integrase n=1 Tax=Microaceticoccus formicicus TaxID=3118105 RepID=UPI003CCFFF19|nr:site-specific integrase [Peptoniphilaceae bacterium AMB_02]